MIENEIKIKKALIIGLGIGSLYKKILTEMFYDITTVDIDPNKNADFTKLEDAFNLTNIGETNYDLGIICLPNYLHAEIANLLIAKGVETILVEKPGFKDLKEFLEIQKLAVFFKSRVFIIKNNYYRNEFLNLKDFYHNNYSNISSVEINWMNKDRVPNPGSWFTNKDLSWGGVSRDLIPHLLHIYYLFSEDFTIPEYSEKKQNFTLEDIKNTSYGVINTDKPIYNVDDFCLIKMKFNNHDFTLSASWKNEYENRVSIKFYLKTNETLEFKFHLCPEQAYKNMIEDIMSEDSFVNDINPRKQFEIDYWVHNIIDNI